MGRREAVLKEIENLRSSQLEEQEFFRDLDLEDSDENGYDEEIEELLLELDPLIIEEDNLDLFEIYTKYIRGYISAYSELPQLIIQMVAQAKAITGTALLELIELIPYIHSGYLSITQPKKESSPGPKKESLDE